MKRIAVVEKTRGTTTARTADAGAVAITPYGRACCGSERHLRGRRVLPLCRATRAGGSETIERISRFAPPGPWWRRSAVPGGLQPLLTARDGDHLRRLWLPSGPRRHHRRVRSTPRLLLRGTADERPRLVGPRSTPNARDGRRGASPHAYRTLAHQVSDMGGRQPSVRGRIVVGGENTVVGVGGGVTAPSPGVRASGIDSSCAAATPV